jgi:tetratricopeptide (TPR) repeat protein
MVLYEILEEKLPVVEGVSTFEQLRSGATSGRRPDTRTMSRAHKQMFDHLWHPDPAKRPKFGRICQKLEKKAYWVRGTDANAFREYKAWLEAEDLSRTQSGDTKDCISEIADNLEIDDEIIQRVLGDCELGNFRAQTAAALMYLTGHIGTVSPYEAAARLVDSPDTSYISLFNTCLRYGNDFGRGALAEIEGRHDEAAAAYKAAALTGNKEAILRYGALLLVHGKEADGIALLRLAAEAGDLRALYTLGDYYFRFKKDDQRALQCFQQCCDPGRNTQFFEPFLMTAVIAERNKDDVIANQALEKALDLPLSEDVRTSLKTQKRAIERRLGAK